MRVALSQSTDASTRPPHLAFVGAGGVPNRQMRHLNPVRHVVPLAVAGVSHWAMDGAKKEFGIAHGFARGTTSATPVEDLAGGTIRFESGTTLATETSFAAHVEKDVWNIQVMGEKGGPTSTTMCRRGKG